MISTNEILLMCQVINADINLQHVNKELYENFYEKLIGKIHNRKDNHNLEEKYRKLYDELNDFVFDIKWKASRLIPIRFFSNNDIRYEYKFIKNIIRLLFKPIIKISDNPNDEKIDRTLVSDFIHHDNSWESKLLYLFLMIYNDNEKTYNCFHNWIKNKYLSDIKPKMESMIYSEYFAEYKIQQKTKQENELLKFLNAKFNNQECDFNINFIFDSFGFKISLMSKNDLDLLFIEMDDFFSKFKPAIKPIDFQKNGEKFLKQQIALLRPNEFQVQEEYVRYLSAVLKREFSKSSPFNCLVGNIPDIGFLYIFHLYLGQSIKNDKKRPSTIIKNLFSELKDKKEKEIESLISKLLIGKNFDLAFVPEPILYKYSEILKDKLKYPSPELLESILKVLKKEESEGISEIINFGNNALKQYVIDMFSKYNMKFENYEISKKDWSWLLYELAFLKENWDQISSIDSKVADQLLYQICYHLEIIPNSYNEQIIKEKISSNLSKYIDKKYLDKIDPIVFADNNMLSSDNQKKFADYEYFGDKLYKVVIDYLKLDYVLLSIKSIDYDTKKLQEKLADIFNIDDIIQSNGLIFFNQESYSSADYLEAFLMSLYLASNNDLHIVINFVHKLFIEFNSDYLIKEKYLVRLLEKSKLPPGSIIENIPELFSHDYMEQGEEEPHECFKLLERFTMNLSDVLFYTLTNNKQESYPISWDGERIINELRASSKGKKYRGIQFDFLYWWKIESLRENFCLECYSLIKKDVKQANKMLIDLIEKENERYNKQN